MLITIEYLYTVVHVLYVWYVCRYTVGEGPEVDDRTRVRLFLFSVLCDGLSFSRKKRGPACLQLLSSRQDTRLLDGTISIQHVPVIVRVQCTSQDSNSIQGLRFLSPWMPGWILICRYADRSIDLGKKLKNTNHPVHEELLSCCRACCRP